MCGVWGALRPPGAPPLPPSTVASCLAALSARGPDATASCAASPTIQLGFTRLAINGLTPAGMQPFSASGSSLVCNGEIYNHASLGAAIHATLTSGSDCEVLLPLWASMGGDAVAFCRSLDGVFALLLAEAPSPAFPGGRLLVARDPYGVRPLYTATTEGGGVRMWASEVKGLVAAGAGVEGIAPFPPGHVGLYDGASGGLLSLTRYHAVPWVKNPSLAEDGHAKAAVRTALTSAVVKRLLAERPIGALLSGGLDSSLIAALVQRELVAAGSPPLQTFSIGMAGSSDLAHARLVADHIGSVHHEVVVSEDEFWGAVPAVVAAIESWDITTVRASVGNWLVARYVAANSDVKVVFNGDGADEASGSYLYFYNAPSDAAFEAEVGRLLEDIHAFDVLRSDRTISCHGLEARTPFLDKQFVATYLSCATALRRPVRAGAGGAVGVPEKDLLRRAFDDSAAPLLPASVLWRRKEAFSDGVSQPTKAWYEVIAERVDGELPGDGWREAAAALGGPPGSAPYTKESFFYRTLFEKSLGKAAVATVPYFWLPRWCGDARDPSARTLAVYAEGDGKG